MAIGRFKIISSIGKIISETKNTEFGYGTNDCNLLVLKLLDLRCNTQYFEKGYKQYSTMKEGYKLFVNNGFKNLLDVVLKHCIEVSVPCFGDIAMIGSHGSVVVNHGKILVLDDANKQFVIKDVNEIKEIKFYRPRRGEHGDSSSN